MTDILKTDICVIGAGSGGLSVAAAAAAFGVPVILVEKGKMGGDCLNYGCVPSKTLISIAKKAHTIRHADQYGLTTIPPVVDFANVRARIQDVIATIAPHDSEERFTGLGVKVLRGAARFTGPDQIEVNGQTIRARRFVIATGSSAFVPPIPGLADIAYLTNETIFDLDILPRHLMIVGGGPIGLELGQAFRRLGSRVTVLEAARALAKDDPELSAVVLSGLRDEGVVIHENTKVLAVGNDEAGISLTLDTPTGQTMVAGSHLLVAAGRAPNVAGLNLEAAGVAYDRRGITVGADLRTTNRKIYAIGDVSGGLQFTHVASYHAGLIIQDMLFRLPARENRGIIPWATFTEPELAHVGLTEAEAKAQHDGVTVLRWPFSGNDRAVAEGDTQGLIKIMVDRRSRILGVSIAGTGAGDQIGQWAIALANKFTLKNIRSTIAPYPTRSEVGKRAAMTYYAPLANKTLIRWLIRFLRQFG
jgi:pyruvate/2-oxoglutarate dehydrogenase complex dihydrolipoamide dehydrogenase (E3) component